MEKIRFDHKCGQEEAERFVSVLTDKEACELKDFQPITDKCHIVRYKFSCGHEKVSVVYDTKAKLLSITAPKSILEDLKKLVAPVTVATIVQAPAAAPERKKESKPPKGGKLPKKQEAVKKAEPPSAGKTKPKPVRPEKPKPAAEKKQEKTNADKLRTEKPKAVPVQSAASTETKKSEEAQDPSNKDYTVKKFAPEKLEGVLKGLKRINGVTYRLESTTAAGTPEETKTYLIKDNKTQKAKLRYMPAKHILQLQGKRSNLFGEVQSLIAGDTDYASAVQPHIELAGEETRTQDVQKLLKKRLPDAYEYLSEQSKIDLTIGLIDISNDDIRLTDYSSLLTPPYRGLEKYVSDLQKAQGIEVKMIGQAYDKADGKYVLKAGYMKRIKSVIYAEVMAALYSEYFARRNFYTHSDNSDESAPRMISDKNEVRAIFDHLLDTINYNSRKLKEIGFSM